MSPQGRDLTIITGMSGAGRSEAANVLEDLGFFVIDNLPPALITKVLDLPREHAEAARFAIVVDVRSGDFLAELNAALDDLRTQGVATRVLFLDAADATIVRRYDASRRRHPLSDTDRVSEGIQRERALLAPLREAADLVIDTTDHNVHELRDRLGAAFGPETPRARMRMSVVTFGYKHGLPLDVDLVFDCRFLPNPHWVEELRPRTGLDPEVRDYVLSRAVSRAFLDDLDAMLRRLVPAYEDEGKSYLTIGIGCTGGRHRSVALAEALVERLRSAGLEPAVRHRDLDRD